MKKREKCLEAKEQREDYDNDNNGDDDQKCGAQIGLGAVQQQP